MVDFSAGYVPPGVYVSTSSTGGTAAIGVGATDVCLVGRGLGYQSNTDTVSYAAGNIVTLSQLGVNTGTVVVTGVVGGTLVTFAPTTDYTISQSSVGPTGTTSVTRVPSGSIPTTGNVSIAYQYTNATYGALNSFTDFQDFVNLYGPPLDPVDGTVLSPLSLAAQIAFQNGANTLWAVALSGVSTVVSQYQTAYALTVNNYSINIIVPLFEDVVDSGSASVEIAQLVSHLQDAETDGFPRTAIMGVAQNFAGTALNTIASTIDYRRVVFVWPQIFNWFNSVTNTTTTIDGFYFAAACAGFLANNPVNQGLTRANIRSFTGIPASSLNVSTTSAKNLWSSEGVAVAELNRQGQLWVRHGVTTDVSNIGNREIPLVRCQDSLFDLIQTTLDQASMIGSPITTQTPLTVKGLVSGALETALAANTIQGYDSLLVRQQSLPSGDPTVIEVTFNYYPTYPLNYITVVFTLDLSTGNITNTTDTSSGGSGGNVPTSTDTTTD